MTMLQQIIQSIPGALGIIANVVTIVGLIAIWYAYKEKTDQTIHTERYVSGMVEDGWADFEMSIRFMGNRHAIDFTTYPVGEEVQVESVVVGTASGTHEDLSSVQPITDIVRISGRVRVPPKNIPLLMYSYHLSGEPTKRLHCQIEVLSNAKSYKHLAYEETKVSRLLAPYRNPGNRKFRLSRTRNHLSSAYQISIHKKRRRSLNLRGERKEYM